jgi:hypothetical protein
MSAIKDLGFFNDLTYCVRRRREVLDRAGNDVPCLECEAEKKLFVPAVA